MEENKQPQQAKPDDEKILGVSIREETDEIVEARDAGDLDTDNPTIGDNLVEHQPPVMQEHQKSPGKEQKSLSRTDSPPTMVTTPQPSPSLSNLPKNSAVKEQKING